MCCKKLLEFHFEKKMVVCTHSNFLVINVCKQGKTLCSPCTSKSVTEKLLGLSEIQFLLNFSVFIQINMKICWLILMCIKFICGSGHFPVLS